MRRMIGKKRSNGCVACGTPRCASTARPLMVNFPSTGQMKMNPYMGSIYVHRQMHYVQAQPGHLPFSGESIF